MAIAHLRIQHISRKAKRSAPAAAAYRSGSRIVNPRDGVVHDYRRRRGVWHSEILTPASVPEWTTDRSQLWGAVELHDTRANARTATELEFALPHELDEHARLDLARRFASSFVAEHGIVADVSVHAPDSRSKPKLAQDGTPLPGGDDRNWHCHLLLSTWTVGPQGFGAKVKPFDKPAQVEAARARWQTMCNEALEAASLDQRIDMRSYARQGRDQAAGTHLSPQVIALAQRGIFTEQYERFQTARKIAQLEQELVELETERQRQAEITARARVLLKPRQPAPLDGPAEPIPTVAQQPDQTPIATTPAARAPLEPREPDPGEMYRAIKAAEVWDTDWARAEQTTKTALATVERLPAYLQRVAARAEKLAKERRQLSEAYKNREREEQILQRLQAAAGDPSEPPPGFALRLFGRTLFESEAREKALSARIDLPGVKAAFDRAVEFEKRARAELEQRQADWKWLEEVGELRKVASITLLPDQLEGQLRSIENQRARAAARAAAQPPERATRRPPSLTR